MELEREYGIANIWSSIQSFDSLVEDIIVDAEAEMRGDRVSQEMIGGVKQTVDEESAQQERDYQNEVDDASMPAADAESDQATPSAGGTTSHLEEQTSTNLTDICPRSVVPFIGQRSVHEFSKTSSEATLLVMMTKLVAELQKITQYKQLTLE